MNAEASYAAESESVAFMLPNERVATMTAYVDYVQNDGADGLPVSGDALAVMSRGAQGDRKRRRQLAARLRMEAAG